MFGSDNSQQFGVPTGEPVAADDAVPTSSVATPEVPATFPPSAPVAADPFGTSQQVAASDPIQTSQPVANGEDASLLDIKQQALQQLSPLVQHLDQSAEEKFKTTMMMIQASDDKSLVSVAFDAAKQITDDKARAQALLDIINEINYFTQQ